MPIGVDSSEGALSTRLTSCRETSGAMEARHTLTFCSVQHALTPQNNLRMKPARKPIQCHFSVILYIARSSWRLSPSRDLLCLTLLHRGKSSRQQFSRCALLQPWSTLEYLRQCLRHMAKRIGGIRKISRLMFCDSGR